MRVLAPVLVLMAGCTAVDEPAGPDARPDAPWPDAVQEVLSIEGDITWHVDFDEAAERAGKTDCSYTRHYFALEDRSRPWTCRSCNAAFRAEVQMIGGQDDCYAQVTESDVNAVEWVGYSSGTWWRSTRENTALGRSATTAIDGPGFSIASASESRSFDGHNLQFTVEGAMRTGLAAGDLLDGLTPPAASACGWPRAPIETYVGSTVIREGSVLPDAYLPDACGEGTRLHYQVGSFQVIAFVAADGTASQEWSAGAEAAVETLGKQDIPLEVVALLAPSEEDRYASAADVLQSYAESSGLRGPVLDHRGYGPLVLGGGDPVVWPVVAVVAPDLEVLSLQRDGFGGWTSVIATIEAAARRE